MSITINQTPQPSVSPPKSYSFELHILSPAEHDLFGLWFPLPTQTLPIASSIENSVCREVKVRKPNEGMLFVGQDTCDRNKTYC